MAINTILFDTDGVAVIRPSRWSAAYEKKFGLPPEKMLPFFNGPFTDCLIGKNDLKTAIQPYLKEWGWSGNVEDLLLFWFEAENYPNNDLINYIQELRHNGIHCHLATNQEKYRTKFLREKMKFKNIFEKIYSSADLGYKKPQPEFFEKVYGDLASETAIAKSEILFCDDTPANITAASEFGFQTHLYTNFVDFKTYYESLS